MEYGHVTTFTMPVKVELKPKNWLFRTISELKFDVVVKYHGELIWMIGATNEELSKLAITSIIILKAPIGVNKIAKVKEG